MGTRSLYALMWTIAWVVTLLQSKDAKGIKITFWETLTGEHLDIEDPKIGAFYQTIKSIFSNTKFYANVQADDRIGKTQLDFGNEKNWKSISKEKLELLLPWNVRIGLADPTINISQAESLLTGLCTTG